MALAAQARIGWLAMLRGYWTLEWQAAYERTYKIPDFETRKEKLKMAKQSYPNDLAKPYSIMEA
jgi:hypothetical protein